MKTKNSSNKILPPVSIEPLAQDFKSSMLPLGVIICYWNFLFSRSKVSDANIGIIANVVCL